MKRLASIKNKSIKYIHAINGNPARWDLQYTFMIEKLSIPGKYSEQLNMKKYIAQSNQVTGDIIMLFIAINQYM